MTLRLVSWNIRDLSGDPLAVYAVLRELDADVVCLQEAPRRPGSRVRMAALARGSGLHHVTGGRGSGGTALLVGAGVRVDGVGRVRLPVPHWYSRTRGAVIARIALPATRLAAGAAPGASSPESAVTSLVVASVHLPLHPDQRLAHARLVRSELEARSSSAGAVVVAGDFNEPVGSPAWQTFEALAADPAPHAGPTFPARRPGGRIDAVLVGPGLQVVEYGDGAVSDRLVRRASDHVPVVVVLGPSDSS